MTAHVALLRGINVGGNKAVAMADLRELTAALGHGEPRTLLNSGNLVFHGRGATAKLERAFEEAVERRLGVQTAFVIRTAAEWAALIADNPLAAEAARAPSHFLAIALKAAPAAGKAEALRALVRGPELVEVRGRCAYVAYVGGIAGSKLSLDRIERGLGVQGTGRNWNTVLKLAALVAG